eukprot:scaffold14874_cov127-Skeletonema_menzelii.AAC.1
MEGTVINRGKANAIYSPDNKYQLILTNSGNLRLNSCTGTFSTGSCSGSSAVEWKSGTTTGTVAALQEDGNLVLYAGPSAIWSSGTCYNCS